MFNFCFMSINIHQNQSTPSYNQTIHNIEDIIIMKNISFLVNFILAIVGLIDNIVCIYIFLQRKMIKIKFNWYLLILAIFHLLFCFILFLDYLFWLVCRRNPVFLHDLKGFRNGITDHSLHFIDSYVTIITMILSIDRCQAIKNPTQIRKLLTYVHSKRLLSLTLILLIVLKIPCIVLENGNSESNIKITFCKIISPSVLNLFPALIILTANMLLVFKITEFYGSLRRNSWFASFRSSIRSSNVSKRNS